MSDLSVSSSKLCSYTSLFLPASFSSQNDKENRLTLQKDKKEFQKSNDNFPEENDKKEANYDQNAQNSSGSASMLEKLKDENKKIQEELRRLRDVLDLKNLVESLKDEDIKRLEEKLYFKGKQLEKIQNNCNQRVYSSSRQSDASNEKPRMKVLPSKLDYVLSNPDNMMSTHQSTNLEKYYSEATRKGKLQTHSELESSNNRERLQQTFNAEMSSFRNQLGFIKNYNANFQDEIIELKADQSKHTNKRTYMRKQASSKLYEFKCLPSMFTESKDQCETTFCVFKAYQLLNLSKIPATLSIQKTLNTGCLSLIINRCGFRQIVDLTRITYVKVMSQNVSKTLYSEGKEEEEKNDKIAAERSTMNEGLRLKDRHKKENDYFCVQDINELNERKMREEELQKKREKETRRHQGLLTVFKESIVTSFTSAYRSFSYSSSSALSSYVESKDIYKFTCSEGLNDEKVTDKKSEKQQNNNDLECIFEIHILSVGVFTFQMIDKKSMSEFIFSLRQFMKIAADSKELNEKKQLAHCMSELENFFYGDETNVAEMENTKKNDLMIYDNFRSSAKNIIKNFLTSSSLRFFSSKKEATGEENLKKEGQDEHIFSDGNLDDRCVYEDSIKEKEELKRSRIVRRRSDSVNEEEEEGWIEKFAKRGNASDKLMKQERNDSDNTLVDIFFQNNIMNKKSERNYFNGKEEKESSNEAIDRCVDNFQFQFLSSLSSYALSFFSDKKHRVKGELTRETEESDNLKKADDFISQRVNVVIDRVVKPSPISYCDFDQNELKKDECESKLYDFNSSKNNVHTSDSEKECEKQLFGRNMSCHSSKSCNKDDVQFTSPSFRNTEFLLNKSNKKKKKGREESLSFSESDSKKALLRDELEQRSENKINPKKEKTKKVAKTRKKSSELKFLDNNISLLSLSSSSSSSSSSFSSSFSSSLFSSLSASPSLSSFLSTSRRDISFPAFFPLKKRNKKNRNKKNAKISTLKKKQSDANVVKNIKIGTVESYSDEEGAKKKLKKKKKLLNDDFSIAKYNKTTFPHPCNEKHASDNNKVNLCAQRVQPKHKQKVKEENRKKKTNFNKKKAEQSFYDSNNEDSSHAKNLSINNQEKNVSDVLNNNMTEDERKFPAAKSFDSFNKTSKNNKYIKPMKRRTSRSNQKAKEEKQFFFNKQEEKKNKSKKKKCLKNSFLSSDSFRQSSGKTDHICMDERSSFYEHSEAESEGFLSLTLSSSFLQFTDSSSLSDSSSIMLKSRKVWKKKKESSAHGNLKKDDYKTDFRKKKINFSKKREKS